MAGIPLAISCFPNPISSDRNGLITEHGGGNSVSGDRNSQLTCQTYTCYNLKGSLQNISQIKYKIISILPPIHMKKNKCV